MPTRLALVRAYEDRCSPTYDTEWSVGGTYDSNAERREVRRATRLLSRSQGSTGETKESLAAKDVTRSQTHRDAELRIRQLVASALRPTAAG